MAKRVAGNGVERRGAPAPPGHESELELALLKRSVDAISAECERCARCRRTPLIGERVYLYESGRLACELCRALQRGKPVESRVVHSSELGNAVRIRITDRREVA